jgi:alpha-tubulin suppressor-like RCC1 family protein
MLCIENMQQDAFITQYLPVTSEPGVHIGLDRTNSSHYQWFSGCETSFGNNLPWSSGEPTGGAEYCSSMIRSTGLFNDINCDTNSQGCGCEQVFTTSTKVCPVGWILSADGNRCYYFPGSDTAMTWSSCKTYCQSQSAGMLCIQSQAQQDDFISIRGGEHHTWIGYSATSLVLSDWDWNSGCTSSYTNWDTLEPNILVGSGYSSIYSATGKWADFVSSATQECACQLSSINATPFPTSQPSGRPTAQPSRQPTRQPTSQPSRQPTSMPTAQPSARPSCHPSARPTQQPSSQPTGQPSSHPTALPSGQPSTEPTQQPSTRPSLQPSALPTAAPTNQPSSLPSSTPSARPSLTPSAQPTVSPTILPTTQPSSVPSSQPTSAPSATPSARPSVQPSVQPTTAPSLAPWPLDTILLSPTYHVRNGFAFAAVAHDGSARSWGEGPYGGDPFGVQHWLSSNISSVFHTRFGMLALKKGGTAVVWGHVADAVPGQYGQEIAGVVAAEDSLAMLTYPAGRVLALGNQHTGGNVVDDAYCSGYSQRLSAGVQSIAASAGAFAAVKIDGTVYSWGSKHTGGGMSTLSDPRLVAVQKVVATREAFAALASGGRVITWGSAQGGGDSSRVSDELQHSVLHVIAGRSAFVAFKRPGRLVVWGNRRNGGDASRVAPQLNGDVVYVAQTYAAFAALKSDGSVVTWGHETRGGDSFAVEAQLTNITHIVGAAAAFAAVNASGGVVTWGHPSYGGRIPADMLRTLSSGVVSIYHTDHAFAALKEDGSVVAWGREKHGGSPGADAEALLTSGVHTVCANDVAFSAIKSDGSVVAWGHEVSIPSEGVQFTSTSLTQSAKC